MDTLLRNKKFILATLVFVISVGLLSYPARHKGYYVDEDQHQLLAAQNFAIAGTYNSEDSHGVILSSSQAVERGAQIGLQNQLTSILYGQLFRLFGVSVPVTHSVSIVLFSVFASMLFLLTTRLFSISTGLLVGILTPLIPVVAVMANMSATYEFAAFFFGGALYLFLGSKSGPFKATALRLGFASALFSIAALARNAFAVSFVPFLLYDYYKHRSWRRSAVMLLPFLVIFGLTLTKYSYLQQANGYTTSEAIPFGQLGHLFVDPYSFYYDSEAYIENLRETDGFDRIGVVFAKRLGYGTTIADDVKAYAEAARFYPVTAMGFTTLGGPLVIALILFGARELRRRNHDLFVFSLLWLAVWYLALIYLQFGNWDHFVEIIFPLLIMITLGSHALVVHLFADVQRPFTRRLFVIIAAALLFAHLGYASQWRFRDAYRSSIMDETLILAEAIQRETLPGDGVIATGVHANLAYALALYTDRNTVVFDITTLQKLLDKGEIKQAFELYSVESIAGYPEDISRKIEQETGVSVFLLPN